MRRRFIILVLLSVVGGGALLSVVPRTTPVVSGKTIKLTREPLSVWSTYEGVLEARSPTVVLSTLRGSATVVALASEGAEVVPGDLLVRFDSSTLEREVMKMEGEYAAAESELSSLRHAKAPLEVRELSKKVMEARSALVTERTYLKVLSSLIHEDLVSQQEVDQQQAKVAELTAQFETATLQLQLTKDYLHPAALKRAQAQLEAVEQELRLARELVQNSVIHASKSGVVLYRPLHIGTEFRPARIGDSLYPNQPFMLLTDLADLLVYCDVPEAELGRVEQGKEVYVQPLAFPDVRLRGMIERVSPIAKNAPGRPVYEKFFEVVVGVVETHPHLRPGMSVTAQVLSYYKPDALSIPRSAVWWDNGKPYGRVLTGSSQEIRPLRLGMANERAYEVIEGLEPGSEVVLP